MNTQDVSGIQTKVPITVAMLAEAIMSVEMERERISNIDMAQAMVNALVPIIIRAEQQCAFCEHERGFHRIHGGMYFCTKCEDMCSQTFHRYIKGLKGADHHNHDSLCCMGILVG